MSARQTTIPGAVYDDDGCCIQPAMTPVEFIELFALAYQKGCATSRDHLMFHLAEDALNSSFRRGQEYGKREGYGQAIRDMELAQHKGQEFVKKLLDGGSHV